ncbi:putative RNA-directed DNA polymerase from transposon BS [Trichonephila clavipes]|nr:putative RNA-directed DNA polymerase from transposon BS [Trichonephila clavipes]
MKLCLKGFHYWYDDTTDCSLGKLALGAGFELLRTFGLKISLCDSKAIQGIGGDPKSVKKLRSGDLLIETLSALQTKSFLLAKTFLDCPLTVSPHKSLNSSRGVISEPDLIFTPETEILEEFSGQGVIQLHNYPNPTLRLPNSTTTTTTQTDENITKIVCPPLKLLQPLVSVPKPTISSSVAAVNKSSTSTQAELVPSTSLVTVASPSISQPPNSVIDTAPTTSNSLSISATSSSSTACSVLETTTTISNTIPATSQDTIQTSKPRRKKRPPKNQSNTVKPKIEIKTAPHRPRKSGPTEYTTDEEDMIIYDVEDEPEPNPKYVLNMNGFTYKGELINKPNQSFIKYDFDNPIKKPF